MTTLEGAKIGVAKRYSKAVLVNCIY